jgi:hypothetical protein
VEHGAARASHRGMLHAETHGGIDHHGMEQLGERERRDRWLAWVYFGVLATAIVIVISSMVYALFG